MPITVGEMREAIRYVADATLIRFSFMNDPDGVDTVEFHSVKTRDGVPIIHGEVLLEEEDEEEDDDVDGG